MLHFVLMQHLWLPLAYCADKNVTLTFRSVPAVWRLCLKSSSDPTAHFGLFIKPLTHRTWYCVRSSPANWKHHLTRRLEGSFPFLLISSGCFLSSAASSLYLYTFISRLYRAFHRIVSAVHNLEGKICFCWFLWFFQNLNVSLPLLFPGVSKRPRPFWFFMAWTKISKIQLIRNSIEIVFCTETVLTRRGFRSSRNSN